MVGVNSSLTTAAITFTAPISFILPIQEETKMRGLRLVTWPKHILLTSVLKGTDG